MALILCLETATTICSVSLTKNGTIIATRESIKSHSHAELINQFIDEVIEESGFDKTEIDAVAVSSGPGSYTGIRIGMATAKGLCYGLDCKLISINTLQSLAQIALNQLDKTPLCPVLIPMIDARRLEVFTATYNEKLDEIELTKPIILDNVPFPFQKYKDKEVYFFGSGAEKAKPFMSSINATFLDVQCSATGLASIADRAFAQKNFADIVSSNTKAEYFKDFHFKTKNLI